MYNKRKLITIIISAAFVTLLFAIFSPLELYYANCSEFWFGVSTFLPLIIISALTVFGALAFIGLLLHNNGAKVYCNLLIGLGIGLYVQGNFLNIGMQNLAGQEVDWCNNKEQLLLNCLIWILCLGLPQILTFCRKGRYQIFVWVLIATVTAMQGASLVATAISAEPFVNKGNVQLTTDGMFELSSQKNIVKIWFRSIAVPRTFTYCNLENDNVL